MMVFNHSPLAAIARPSAVAPGPRLPRFGSGNKLRFEVLLREEPVRAMAASLCRGAFMLGGKHSFHSLQQPVDSKIAQWELELGSLPSANGKIFRNR